MTASNLETWIKRFLDELIERRGRSRNTIEAYRSDLQQFLRLLPSVVENGQLPVEWRVVRSTHIRAYLALLRNQGLSPASLNRKLVALRGFFDFLLENGQVSEDPMSAIQAVASSQPQTTLLTFDEVFRLLHAAEEDISPIGLRDRAILELLYTTGMRASELLALNLEDLDLEAGTVQCGAELRRRVLPLSRPAREALVAYLKKGRPSLVKVKEDTEQPALFVNTRGQRMSRQGLWSRLKYYAKKAGISKPISPQSLRNSFAVHLLHMGVAPNVVQERLGNSSLASVRNLRNLDDSLPNGFVLPQLSERLVID